MNKFKRNMTQELKRNDIQNKIKSEDLWNAIEKVSSNNKIKIDN